jgi:3-carboxy-cis,cis-muconate cycloisomerase
MDQEAAAHVHRGATSQDIADTAVVLQMREATALVMARLARAADAAAVLARRHALTPMAGRTWLQQAAPVTFGLKAAGWLDALDRTTDGLGRASGDASTLQFGGAAGTLGALGTSGEQVAEALARRLHLRLPDLPWHAHRDRLAQLACQLAIVAGTLGKIARDTSLLGQTEVGEAAEGGAPGRGGSSTMPQKRNPVRAAVVLSAATRAPGLVATMLAALPQEHERGLGGWHAEWTTLPLLTAAVAGSALAAAHLLETLEVDPRRMRANLAADGGLVMAEALSGALSQALGRPKAHAIVEDVSRRARAEGRELADVAAETAAVAEHLDRQRLSEVLAPDRHLGATQAFVARVLARHERRTTDRR